MNKISKLLSVVIFITFFASILTSDEYKRYSLKSAIIEYKLSGMETGKETLYFDNFGMKEARVKESTIEYEGKKIKRKITIILDGKTAYTVDYDSKSVAKITNDYKDLTKGFNTKNLGEIGKKMMTDMGGKLTGSENILGRKCEIWNLDQYKTKSWIWNYITLKMATELPNMKTYSEAVKIQENAKIPESVFQYPKDFKVYDMNKQQKPTKGKK